MATKVTCIPKNKSVKKVKTKTKVKKPVKSKASAPMIQTHVHEFLGSVMLALPGDLRHNHRFAGVTSQVIPRGNSHVHAIFTRTDFLGNHFHEIGMETGPAIPVGNGKHVHFATGKTTMNAGHQHGFQFATLIQDPLL